jgi:hypothetical protein
VLDLQVTELCVSEILKKLKEQVSEGLCIKWPRENKMLLPLADRNL